MGTASSIPFVKPSRVGNFKLWRSKVRLAGNTPSGKREGDAGKGNGQKLESIDLECINVSNLDGSWSVRIPSTSMMFEALGGLHADYTSDDKEKKAKASDALSLLLGNMLSVSFNGNGFYQQGVRLVGMCFANPAMLEENDELHPDLMEETRWLVGRMLEWWHDWRANAEASEPKDDDLKQEDIAEQARELQEGGDNGKKAE